MLFLTKPVLLELYNKDYLEKLDENTYEFVSTYKYERVHLRVGEIVPTDPSSFSSDSKISTYIYQIADMAETSKFFALLNQLSRQHSLDPVLQEKIFNLASHVKLSQQKLTALALDYSNFLATNGSWNHVKKAQQYGISIQTLKEYLRNLDLYDNSRHKNPHNLNLSPES